MMSFDNNHISKGLSLQYSERAKQNKSSIAVNNKTVNADYNGNEAYKKMQKGLSAKEKKNIVQEISFYTEHTLNRKYIDEIFCSKNVNETVLLVNSMQKRVQELNGYLLSNLKSRRAEAEKELQDILYVFDVYSDKID